MGYLNNTSVTVDAILTKKGRELLAKNDGSFRITQFSLSDDEIDYTLYNPFHPSGSAYYGEAIEAMPILEAFPDETQIMKYKLPVLDVGYTSITLRQGATLAITPQTLNYLGATTAFESSGYTATIGDSRILSTFNGVGVNTTEAIALNSTTTIGTNVSRTVVGTTINLTATTVNTLFGTRTSLTTILTITGRDSGARITIPVIITLIPGLSPTRITYGQFRTLINGDENTNLNFGTGNTNSSDFYVININRANYKEKLFPGTFNLTLSGSTTGPLKLTDNSVSSTTLSYCDAGRVFDIISGSNGLATSATPFGGAASGYTVSGSYGKFLPDVGLIILNPQALKLTVAQGGIALTPGTSNNNTTLNATNVALKDAINKGASFALNSEETITSDYMFVRIKNGDFNYTTNPSMISGSGEFYFPSLVNNPQTYITTVGLYNDNNELLGVAKLSKPLVKDFTKEALIRVKLDF